MEDDLSSSSGMSPTELHELAKRVDNLPGAGRVLRREEHEVRVRLDRLLELGDEELAIIVEEAVQSLEDVGGGQVELVEDDPVPAANSLHERALLKRKLACGAEQARE